MALYLTEGEIAGLLTMPEVVDALEEMFRARARGEIVNRPRTRVPITAGSYNVMYLELWSGSAGMASIWSRILSISGLT